MERTFPLCCRLLSRPLISHSAAKPSVRKFSSTLCPPPTPQRTCKSSVRIPPIGPRRCIHSSPPNDASRRPRSHDRGPQSSEDTKLDFSALDVLRNTAAPATSIDACTDEGFALNNNMKIAGCGVLLVGGEVFRWRPWLSEDRKERNVGGGAQGEDAITGRLLNVKGQWEVSEEAWGLLDVVWPKPDLLIIGTGPRVTPIAPATRRYLNGLGIRLEIQDTRNAAAQFNLLATERGVQQVAAALIPIGWKEMRRH